MPVNLKQADKLSAMNKQPYEADALIERLVAAAAAYCITGCGVIESANGADCEVYGAAFRVGWLAE